MISESRFWKAPLLKTAKRLAEKKWQNSEKSLVEIERELFIGFYSVRKLLDTFKVCDSSRALKVTVGSFPCRKSVDYLNSHRIDELYDLSSNCTQVKDLLFVCNQFIHSYVFSVAIDDGGVFQGCYVTSDREKNNLLRFISSDVITLIFVTIGNDDPHKWHMQRNPLTLQWEGSVS